MIVRDAEIDDAEWIAKNNVLLARESENANVEYETTLKGVKEVLKDKNKGFYLVAEKNNKIIGQLLVTYEWSEWRDKQIWWLQSIYVIPSERRRVYRLYV
ncbi:MAG: GNAT family N-acetyltransferase, partial [Thermoplasmata archaeon]